MRIKCSLSRRPWRPRLILIHFPCSNTCSAESAMCLHTHLNCPGFPHLNCLVCYQSVVNCTWPQVGLVSTLFIAIVSCGCVWFGYFSFKLHFLRCSSLVLISAVITVLFFVNMWLICTFFVNTFSSCLSLFRTYSVNEVFCNLILIWIICDHAF